MCNPVHTMQYCSSGCHHIYCYFYRTQGDGNCLYRACSKLLCGKEDLCYLLRDLTSIELFRHQEFYAVHPHIKENAHFFNSVNNAFSASVSDGALADGYDCKDPCSRTVVVKREAIRNATNGIYSSLLCVFALSSVTGMGLISVYPEKLGKETKYSQFQNGTISPRARHDSFSSKLVQEAKIIIMWTTDGVLTHNETFQPNHFVPLVEFTTKQKNTEGLPTVNQQKFLCNEKKLTFSKKWRKSQQLLLKVMFSSFLM